MSFGFSRNRHLIKIALFCAIAHLTMKAAISAPLFVVEKALEPQLMTVVITGSQLPELRSITFTCSYVMPKAALMEAIVASPQPRTALSVQVDSATSTLSITIRATTTLTPGENSRIVLLKIPTATSFGPVDFTVAAAVILNMAGTSATVAVNNKTTTIGTPFPAVAVHLRQPTAGSTAVYGIDGRRIGGSFQKGTSGISILRYDAFRIAAIVSVR